ncbi:MAG: hypothetical protein FWF75_07395, partial [Propionibacteriaceae bacterium]|nr:hypothetical protein [Propionibacteriaceae bacterium]
PKPVIRNSARLALERVRDCFHVKEVVMGRSLPETKIEKPRRGALRAKSLCGIWWQRVKAMREKGLFRGYLADHPDVVEAVSDHAHRGDQTHHGRCVGEVGPWAIATMPTMPAAIAMMPGT